MPLALVILAALLIMVGVKGNYAQVGQQFQQDVLGQGGYFRFVAGLIGIAVFFRLIGMPNAGKVFIILVLAAYLMENSNVLTSLQSAIGGGSSAGTTSTGSPTQLAGATTASPIGTVFAPGTSGPGNAPQ